MDILLLNVLIVTKILIKSKKNLKKNKGSIFAINHVRHHTKLLILILKLIDIIAKIVL